MHVTFEASRMVDKSTDEIRFDRVSDVADISTKERAGNKLECVFKNVGLKAARAWK